MSFLHRLDLGGRSLVVAGGGTPIGRAIWLFAARHGLGSLVLLDSDEASLEAASVPARELGVTVSTHTVEVGDLAALTASLSAIERTAGLIDLLVNATDEPSTTPFKELERAEWDAVAVSQVKAVFATCRVFVPRMVERQYGRVLNVASVAGKRGSEGLGGPAYAAAHGAINGFTRALAREFAGSGVRVNAINRGITAEDDSGPDSGARVGPLASVPLGREARLDEVAAAAVYLLSDASAYVTGETLNVDGGMAME